MFARNAPHVLSTDLRQVFDVALANNFVQQSGDMDEIIFTCTAPDIPYCFLGTFERKGPILVGDTIPETLGIRFLTSFPDNDSVYRCTRPASSDGPYRCEVQRDGAWQPIDVQ